MSFPLTNFRFFVSLDLIDAYMPPGYTALIPPTLLGRFSDVTGLNGELEILSYVEGGQNDFVHELPVKHRWGRLTFAHGLVGNNMWSWFQAGMAGPIGARRDGAIVLLDADGLPSMTWTFRAGIATKWTGPDLSALTGAVAVEKLEVAHHGLTQVIGPGGDQWPM